MRVYLSLWNKESRATAPVCYSVSLQVTGQREASVAGKDGRMGQETCICSLKNATLCWYAVPENPLSNLPNTWNFEMSCLAAEARVKSCPGECRQAAVLRPSFPSRDYEAKQSATLVLLCPFEDKTSNQQCQHRLDFSTPRRWCLNGIFKHPFVLSALMSSVNVEIVLGPSFTSPFVPMLSDTLFCSLIVV